MPLPAQWRQSKCRSHFCICGPKLILQCNQFNIPFLRAHLYGNIFVCQYYLLQNEKIRVFSLVFSLGLSASRKVKRRKVKYVPERTITGMNDL